MGGPTAHKSIEQGLFINLNDIMMFTVDPRQTKLHGMIHCVFSANYSSCKLSCIVGRLNQLTVTCVN